MKHTAAFRAMGTDCVIMVYGGPAASNLLSIATKRIHGLEKCWTRFHPESELSRVNRHQGSHPIPISEDMLTLLLAMRDAYLDTRGLFDPTISVAAAGYVTDFANVLWDVTAPTAAPAPGFSNIEINESDRAVALQKVTKIDPGGIGKGLAADMVVADLLSAGVDGALVNLGGDISAAGYPDDEFWVIDGPNFDRAFIRSAGAGFGVVTSSTKKRAWGPNRHHVINPATGLPTNTGIADVTVAGPSAATSEAWATAIIVSGEQVPPGMRETGHESWIGL